jgi:hypothetical protein
VTVKDGALKLIRRMQQLNLAIDHFFESLAEDCGSRAIGVILSGSGTDGTAGLRAIKAAAGLTFAQSEASVKFDAMPRSAIRAGFVDAALAPREIAQQIGRVADHSYIRRPMADGEDMKTRKETHPKADDLGRIFFSLRKQMGVDFSSYKHATLLRRIQRRMALHRMEKLSQYAKLLRDNKREIETLFDDLLINVTHFFRDERLFRELKKRFLPALLKSKKENQDKTLRAWVPGCATGEEVYSLAICILETLGQRGSNMNIQIFGTDLSESTIEYARRNVPTPRLVDLVSYRGYEFPETLASLTSSRRTDFDTQLLEIADRIMLSAYAPAAVVIDDALHIEQFRGRTDDYLEQMPGPATRNLLQLVRPSMVADLRAAVDRAIKTGKPTRKERALVKFDAKTREVNIEIVPFKLPASNKSWLLVIFDEATKGARPGRLLEVLGKTTTQRKMSEMRRELSASQSAGQELLSRNEELQLMNEELETAKEELQSTNEELTTLNDELSNRNLEMMQLTSDLDNLLISVQIPIVMVDRALMVRRATPTARNAFNILPTDIGRRITELRPNIDVPDLENILRDVTETLNMQERKVKDVEGREYSLRVRPYRTIDNKIDGAVIMLVQLGGKK